jgi:hypothetical protein
MLRQKWIVINFMKRITLIFSILIACTTVLHAQSHGEYAIYDTIIKRYKRVVPSRSTNAEILKDFNFKDQKEYFDFSRDTLNTEWKEFFNNIDASNIKSGALDSAFLSKYPQPSDSTRKIILSPIVLSADGNKAICGSSLSHSGEYMDLFEKKNGKWTFRKRYVVYVE